MGEARGRRDAHPGESGTEATLEETLGHLFESVPAIADLPDHLRKGDRRPDARTGRKLDPQALERPPRSGKPTP